MADARGNLALEFLRLAERCGARWVLWENVPGVLSSNDGRDFGAFLGGLAELGYGFAYRVLDAQYFGLAQRRKRVFVVGYLGDWRRAAAVLFETASLRGNTPPRREARERVADPVSAGSPGGSGYRNDADTSGNLIAFGGNRQSGPLDVATAVNAHGGPHGRLDLASETFVTHSLRAEGHDASEDGTGRGVPLVASGSSSVRRLTPRECERLMGVPDDWTAIQYRGKAAADGPRYRALGNAFAVPVVRWIAKRISAAAGE